LLPAVPLFPYTTLFRSLVCPFVCLGALQWGRPAGRRAAGAFREVRLATADGWPSSKSASYVERWRPLGARWRDRCRVAGWKLGRSEEHTSELQSRGHLV